MLFIRKHIPCHALKMKTLEAPLNLVKIFTQPLASHHRRSSVENWSKVLTNFRRRNDNDFDITSKSPNNF